MRAIQDAAELAIRNLFRSIAGDAGQRILSAIDYMDDGTPLCLKITIDGHSGSAVFDFSGTGSEVLGVYLSHHKTSHANYPKATGTHPLRYAIPE